MERYENKHTEKMWGMELLATRGDQMRVSTKDEEPSEWNGMNPLYSFLLFRENFIITTTPFHVLIFRAFKQILLFIFMISPLLLGFIIIYILTCNKVIRFWTFICSGIWNTLPRGYGKTLFLQYLSVQNTHLFRNCYFNSALLLNGFEGK